MILLFVSTPTRSVDALDFNRIPVCCLVLGQGARLCCLLICMVPSISKGIRLRLVIALSGYGGQPHCSWVCVRISHILAVAGFTRDRCGRLPFFITATALRYIWDLSCHERLYYVTSITCVQGVDGRFTDTGTVLRSSSPAKALDLRLPLASPAPYYGNPRLLMFGGPT